MDETPKLLDLLRRARIHLDSAKRRAAKAGAHLIAAELEALTAEMRKYEDAPRRIRPQEDVRG